DDIWCDMRFILYNAEWDETHYITVQDEDITKQIAMAVVVFSNGSKKNMQDIIENRFRWYYKEQTDQFQVCISSSLAKKKRVNKEDKWYVATVYEVTSFTVNNKNYSGENFLKKLKFNSNQNQLICLNSRSYPNILEELSHTCFYYDQMCYTGEQTDVIDLISTGDIISVDDEHKFMGVEFANEKIQLKIFNLFSFNDEGALEENRSEYIENYYIPHCKNISED
ncbi:MAG: hypothetical protein KDD58_07810, partial [Bdellovibrionales bacterium]|nr:hypothetical protein [Bdellovibrionales bacterium]